MNKSLFSEPAEPLQLARVGVGFFFKDDAGNYLANWRSRGMQEIKI